MRWAAGSALEGGDRAAGAGAAASGNKVKDLGTEMGLWLLGAVRATWAMSSVASGTVRSQRTVTDDGRKWDR